MKNILFLVLLVSIFNGCNSNKQNQLNTNNNGTRELFNKDNWKPINKNPVEEKVIK